MPPSSGLPGFYRRGTSSRSVLTLFPVPATRGLSKNSPTSSRTAQPVVLSGIADEDEPIRETSRLARKCFFGQRGELRQHYREGQEDQLGALGLVVNALILWNPRYMDAALTYLKSQGFEPKPEDLASGHTFSQPDLIIAATAAHHGMTVVTRDRSLFDKARVPVVNPWDR